MAATTRAFVGRGALTPPGPAAAQTFAGGMNPAPTNKFYVLGRPGWPRPCVRTNLCRGRCLHRPGGPVVPEGPREGHGPPLQILFYARSESGGVPVAVGAGGMNPAPTNKFCVLGRPGWPRPCVITNLCRGRCLHRPANLATAGTSCGRIWNPPLQNGAFPRAAFGGGAIPPAAPGARPPPFDKGGKLRPGIKFCAASFLTTRNMVYWTGSYKNLI